MQVCAAVLSSVFANVPSCYLLYIILSPYSLNIAYAKLGMGPLWKEIMSNIVPIVSANHSLSGTPPPKLALFSGHDTTLMPILATLGEKVWSGTEWAPYASMILIEIHVINSEKGSDFQSGYGFRLIYNGQVLTPEMDGCNSEICDSQVLLKQVMPFAKYQERDCAALKKSDGVIGEMKEATESLVASPGGVWALVSLMLVSMTLGCMLTYFWMKRRMSKRVVYRQESTRVVDDDDPGIDLATCGANNGKANPYQNTLI